MAKKFKFRYVNEIVGGFVLLVCVLLLAGVIVAGRAQQWFEKMVEIELRFPPEGSMDLQKGAEVMLLGARVGSVQDILVDDAGNITGSIRVRGSFMRFVREDTVALVKKKLVVTGDAFIELTRGSGAELPKTGAEIPCVKDTEILQMVEEGLDVLLQEAENTLRLVNTAITEYTLLAENLNDPKTGLPQLMAQVDGLIGDIRRGEGIPAKVLNDPAMADDLAGIVSQTEALLAKVNAMADDLRQVSGKLPAMADVLAGEVDHLPVVIGESQTLMRETILLLDGLQKHWFLRKYVESDDALRSGEVLVP